MAHAGAEHFLLSALEISTGLPQLKQTHALILRLDLHHRSVLATKLLRRLTDHGVPMDGYPLRLFAHTPRPTPFLWTALIRGYALIGPDPARRPLHLYALMRRRLVPPLSFTLSAVLKSTTTPAAASQIHAHVLLIGGFEADPVVHNALIQVYLRLAHLHSARKLLDDMPLRDPVARTSLVVAYARNNDMESARRLFDDSPVKDLVAWTAVINGYAQNARPVEAIDAFIGLRRAGVGLDEVSLVGAVSACAQLGTRRHAEWVSEIVQRSGFGRNLVVGSAMVDMWTKCGVIHEAWAVFEGMPERNVYTYSSMIAGLAAHGRARDAIRLFEEMVGETEVKPNWVTFIGLLTACSHSGMVAEGRIYFAMMRDECGISPTADHYTCMVDLLGRAGLVEEALELVRSMSVEPHGGVWGALLGACRIHGRTQIAGIAAARLFELEPNCIGNYVLLSNIYASAGMWDEVLAVRKLIRQRGLKKDPSSSWVELDDGTLCEFFSGDTSHPKSAEIRKVLDELIPRLRVEGYAPVLSSVVYNVSDSDKERLLKGHSEKLALAFVLLTTGSERSTIRIKKNLRICEDCHLVLCLASSVVGREIVVRDNMRFHYFSDGECSCGGFW